MRGISVSVQSDTVVTSHAWSLSTCNVASATEELKFHLISF